MLAAVVLAVIGAPAAEPALRVGASPPALSCVEAAARDYEREADRALQVVGEEARGGRSDVFVGVSAEVTRLIEAGQAEEKTELALARIPWVLLVDDPSATRLSDLAGREVSLPAGRFAEEARQALERVAGIRVRVEPDPAALARAPIALLPLSMAPSRPTLQAELDPITVGAVLRRGAGRRAEALAFLNYLATEPGRRSFSACGR